MRLINADALIAEMHNVILEDGEDRRTFYEVIERQPTIELERKKGKWIKKMLITEAEKYTSYNPEWYCACCGAKYDPHIAKIVNFCYVCGADMRER